jgi:sugar phosphate isomerase/epimerase
MITRRNLLKGATALAAVHTLSPLAFAESEKLRFKIGACDWSIGKDSDIGAFELAKKIGLQGIQVNMGHEKNNMHLRNKDLQAKYLAESKRTGIKIASLAIGELNNVPYKSDPRTEQWVSDSIDVAKALGVNVVLLAFFSKNDLRKDDAGKAEVVRRLKEVAPKAEKMGITLGIESYLSAEEHLDIMQKVGSNAIKVYYDFRNSTDAGYNIFEEMKLLGKDNICELHIKENGKLLGNGDLDWPRIRKTLDEIGYLGDGWMQIEWAMPDKADTVASYKHNLAFVKKTFG